MISVFVGKPRNGKSYLAVLRILAILETTLMDVVTNMVLDLDEIQLYTDARGFSINVRSRVRMLTDDQVNDFWLFRVGYELAKPVGYDDRKSAVNVDYSPLFELPQFRIQNDMTKGLRGTLFVIDEIHTKFPARGWQQTTRHADFYCSQHAKLGDQCIFITQNTKLVDPNFYRLAQDFTFCRNGRLEKHGRFRGANKFTAKTYPVPPSTGHEVTLNVEEYKLDLAVAACYDTSAGVGMPGGGSADKGFRVKGISLRWVWVGLGGVLVACWAFFTYVLPHFTNRFMAGAISPGTQAKSVPALPVPASTSTHVSPAVDTEPALWVRGFVISGGGRSVIVWLSDGRTLNERSPGLESIAADGQSVVFEGRRLWLARERVQPLVSANPEPAATRG